MSGEAEHVREAVRQHPNRFIGEYHADPTNIMQAVRGLQEYVEKYGEAVEAKAGSVFLMDSMLIHKAGYNSSGGTRRGQTHCRYQRAEQNSGMVSQRISQWLRGFARGPGLRKEGAAG